MFKNILFATTSSALCNDASDVAFEIARKHNSNLYIFYVFGFPSRGFGPVTDFKTGEAKYCDQAHVDKVKEEIKKTYADKLTKLGDYVIETRAGVPHTEILRFARKKDIDLIIMGPHTRDEKEGLKYKSTLGSTMQDVAQKARCPVIIVTSPVPKEKLEFRNIVFGTDFSKASDAAFLFAYNVAKTFGSNLYLFHALDISPRAGSAIRSQNEIEKSLGEVKEKIKDVYVSRMEDFDNYQIETLEGIPYMEIIKFARGKDADLIIMAHHSKETDQDKALLGSTLEQVVIRSSCPVVSVNRHKKEEE